MGYINGPNIVQDNLIVCYDPQNTQSKNSDTVVHNTVSPRFQGAAYSSFTDLSPKPYPNFLSFNGLNAQPTSDALISANNFPATSAFSLNFWIQHTGTQNGSYQRLFSSGLSRFEVAEDTSNKIRIYEGAWTTSTVTVNSVGWTNIVVINTVDPEIKIYQNGVLEQTISAGRSMTSVAWRLGGNQNTPPNECWKGKLGYFSAYTKELSNAEVIQNYNALKSRFVTS